jgi:hypothetical protein
MPLAVRILVAAAVCLLLYLIAVRMVKALMTRPPPEEPDPATLRPVHHRYRCTVCGTEVTMTAAPGDEAPEPPRHCREDMVAVLGVVDEPE